MNDKILIMAPSEHGPTRQHHVECRRLDCRLFGDCAIQPIWTGKKRTKEPEIKFTLGRDNLGYAYYKVECLGYDPKDGIDRAIDVAIGTINGNLPECEDV